MIRSGEVDRNSEFGRTIVDLFRERMRKVCAKGDCIRHQSSFAQGLVHFIAVLVKTNFFNRKKHNICLYKMTHEKNVPLSQYVKPTKPSPFPAITSMLIVSNHKDDRFLLNVSIIVNLFIEISFHWVNTRWFR